MDSEGHNVCSSDPEIRNNADRRLALFDGNDGMDSSVGLSLAAILVKSTAKQNSK